MPPVEVFVLVPPVEVLVSCPQWRSLFLCPQWRSLFRAPGGGLGPRLRGGLVRASEEGFVYSGGSRLNVHAGGTYRAPVPKDTVVQVSCPRPRAR